MDSTFGWMQGEPVSVGYGRANSHSRPWQDIASSFRWIRGSRVSVAYRGGDSIRGGNILRFLEGLPPLPALPDSLPRAVSLFIAPDRPVFDSLTGGRVPEWGAGVAVPALGRIVVPGFGTQRARGWEEARVLKHEWAHLGLHQFLGGLRPPRWFDEGYAQWASGGWNPSEGWRLRVSLAMGRAPLLDSLVLDWPRDPASAGLAYLLSATAVEYLVRESGERGLRIFLERWREVGNFDLAMATVYGVTPGRFEEGWRKYVRRQYGWLFVLSHSTVFWLALALALLLLFRIRRRRNREVLARLRATEPPDTPEFWDQEPGDAGDEPGEVPQHQRNERDQ
jgi:MYXO-CTERM domain-containing protein